MSTKFTLKSLLQLTQYSYFKDFLTEYHNVVNAEFGQYLGINKALICASKVFSRFESKHEMISELKNLEEKETLFTLKKQLITVVTSSKDGSIIESQEVANYTSVEAFTLAVKADLQEMCVTFSVDMNVLLGRFDTLFEDKEIEAFESEQDIIDAVKLSNIDVYDLINDIEAISDDKLDYLVTSGLIDFNVTPSDIEISIQNLR